MRTLLFLLTTLFSIGLMATPLDTTRLQTPESIVNYCLELISVDKGQQVDTAALRSLFAPKAQLSGLSYPNGNPQLVT